VNRRSHGRRTTNIEQADVVKREKSRNRQITPAVVVGVEERQLLRAVRWVIGRIQIDGNVANPAAESPTMSITYSASASPIRYKSDRRTAFSNRESVGCEARAAPLI
jgi:hypothetical protein